MCTATTGLQWICCAPWDKHPVIQGFRTGKWVLILLWELLLVAIVGQLFAAILLCTGLGWHLSLCTGSRQFAQGWATTVDLALGLSSTSSPACIGAILAYLPSGIVWSSFCRCTVFLGVSVLCTGWACRVGVEGLCTGLAGLESIVVEGGGKISRGGGFSVVYNVRSFSQVYRTLGVHSSVHRFLHPSEW